MCWGVGAEMVMGRKGYCYQALYTRITTVGIIISTLRGKNNGRVRKNSQINVSEAEIQTQFDPKSALFTLRATSLGHLTSVTI